MTPIFDTHAHYDDEAFDPDREYLLRSLPEAGIARVTDIGAGTPSSKAALALAERYDFVFCALGVHPSETGDLTSETYDWLKNAAVQSPKCVAIGEIGLDYHWEKERAEEQKKAFEAQLALAREVGKPVVIHSRDAARDTAEVMKACHAEDLGGVIHCYSYEPETAKAFLDMGFYFGIGGVLTYKNARKLVETVKYLPLDRIVLETDCPYLSPEPHRGKRNSSLNLPLVAEKIAEIKALTTEEVRAALWENAHLLYRLPTP